MIKTGVIGTVIAAICCFTPVLVIGLGVVGLSAWLGWLDYVLLPTLAVFVGVTAYGLWRRQRAAACCETDTKATKETR
ncbi:mercury resistance system transport protein MerF [Maritimibacter sp. 55A14]|nr:mercury resistance system transport protein MerF [Maritimibacter sp. 55A14]